MGWKSFDMRAVVAATEDFLLFVLSDKGLRVRVFLLRDIMKAADAFLQDEVVNPRILDEDQEASNRSKSEVHTLFRVNNLSENCFLIFLDNKHASLQNVKFHILEYAYMSFIIVYKLRRINN